MFAVISAQYAGVMDVDKRHISGHNVDFGWRGGAVCWALNLLAIVCGFDSRLR